MSGGVDSSVAAFLAKEQGYECSGITMKLFQGEEGVPGNRSCCSLDDVLDARSVASSLGMPFYVFNFTEEFDKQVIGRFVESYQRGETPNPCIDCNRYMKFEKLLHRAKELEHDRLVTGHYARIEKDSASGRYLLYKGLDSGKDQSYVLYMMTQDQLARTLLPLGGLTKNQVRKIAEENGFINASKRESQDICFVPDGDYAAFIEAYTGKKCPHGCFVGTDGKVLGEHRGIIRYTVGQRKGLGLAMPEPVYVCSKSAETNTVVLGTERELYSKSLTAKDINLIPFDTLERPADVTVQIRYHQQGQRARLEQTDSDAIHIEFESPQKAVARGQAVVFYDGDMVIGGGTISD
jgi:tRNA-specific 2-thiouridylase